MSAEKEKDPVELDPFNVAVFERVRVNNPNLRWPVVGHQKLDFGKLFKEVRDRGGIDAVIREKKWKDVGRKLELPKSVTNVGFVLKKHYNEFLRSWENQEPGAAAAPAPKPITMDAGIPRMTPPPFQGPEALPQPSPLDPLEINPTPLEFGSGPITTGPCRSGPFDMDLNDIEFQPFLQPGEHGFTLRDQIQRVQELKRPRMEEPVPPTSVARYDMMERTGVSSLFERSMGQDSSSSNTVPLRAMTDLILVMTAQFKEAWRPMSEGTPEFIEQKMKPIIYLLGQLEQETLLAIARAWALKVFLLCRLRLTDSYMKRMTLHPDVDTLIVMDPVGWSGAEWPTGEKVLKVNIAHWKGLVAPHLGTAVRAAVEKYRTTLSDLFINCDQLIDEDDLMAFLSAARTSRNTPSENQTTPLALDDPFTVTLYSVPPVVTGQSSRLERMFLRYLPRLITDCGSRIAALAAQFSQLTTLTCGFQAKSPIFTEQQDGSYVTPNVVTTLYLEQAETSLDVVASFFPRLKELHLSNCLVSGEMPDTASYKLVATGCYRTGPSGDYDPFPVDKIMRGHLG
ncbi:ARID/BRIGHT DNA binding domain [Carpediemonas membranifera]|uniref:ARID/BRIGHT DNA binding domain n=1 Tax=Carpediemonas membranifera TaxID=201153 RepID=A0A8J6AZ70_9EUKA|nr:ARID/BRIGHT DNA binding domain [Carpediemonas membranifera]|eukprot:KAG9390844.1 ARID/BRIGHT DNA binding domain [Carpediemonas membranifera]